MNQRQKRLVRRFLAYKLLTNLWFVGAVWLYFYRLFITDREVGVLDGVAFAIGLIAEVPSGVLADRFGRDRMVKIGQILAGGGLLIQAFGSGFIPFVIGQSIMMIGVSFVSGADEALFFDQLQFRHSSADWRKLLTRSSQIALLGSTIATIVGGALHSINPRIPWYLTGISFVSSALLIWPIREKRHVGRERSFSKMFRAHKREIKSGFAAFFTNNLFLYVPIIVVVQGLFYTVGWGLLRLVLLDRFYFNPLVGSVVVSTCSLLTIMFLAFVHRYASRISERAVLVYISAGAAVSLLFSVKDIGFFGYFVILALYAGEHILYPFMSEIINYHTQESQRATVLSVASFLRTMPYIVLAPVVGYLNARNELEYFLISWSFLIFFAVAFYLMLARRDVQLNIAKLPDDVPRVPPTDL